MSTSDQSCKFCEKKGLPILPIRYGVAPSKAYGTSLFKKAPPDPTTLLGKPEVALGAPETQYTGRRLRGGYLHVYYADHSEWEVFAVDEQSCLSKIPAKGDAPPGGDRFHAACHRDAKKVANASVFTIQDPETAGTIWVGFSDSWWSNAVRSRVAALSDAKRAQFMRKVDVTAWYNNGKSPGTTPEHAFQIYQVNLLVADYVTPEIDAKYNTLLADTAGALSFSPFHYKPHPANTLKQECDELAEAKGLVLCVQDPVSITMELASYMERRWSAFAGPFSRQVTVDGDLSNLEQTVRRQAKDHLVSHVDFKQNAAQSLGDWALTEIADGLKHLFGHKEIPVPDNLSKQSVKTYTDAVWGVYADAINHTKRKAFQDTFKQKSKAYSDHMMAPLAKAHAAWMKSATTTAVFDHHFDPDDINSGVAFTSVLTACISGTVGYGACLKQYSDWLKQGLKAKKGQDGKVAMSDMNVLWRALVYNNPTLAAKLQSLGPKVAQSTKKGGASLDQANAWATVFSAYEAVAGKLHFAGESHSRDLRLQGNDARALMLELGAPLAEIIQQRGAVGGDVLATLGMHAGSPARVVTAYGTPDQFYRSILDALDEIQPKVGNDVATARTFSLYDRMRILNAELQEAGIDPYSGEMRTWSVVLDTSPVDPETLANMTPEQEADVATGRVKAATAIPDDGVIPVDDMVSRTMRSLKTSGMRAGVGLILAAVSWHSAGQAAHDALAGKETEAEFMLWSARTGFLGAAFDLVRVGIESGKSHPNALLGPIARRITARELAFVKGFGAGAGAVSMFIAAGVDFRATVEAIGIDEPGMATLFVTRGAVESLVGVQLGFDLIAVLTSGAVEIVILAGPAAWVALAAIATVSVVISLAEDPETLTWARECDFGKQPESDYENDFVREQKDFYKALASS